MAAGLLAKHAEGKLKIRSDSKTPLAEAWTKSERSGMTSTLV